jgi:uncharacterized protein (TIGR02246 family)
MPEAAVITAEAVGSDEHDATMTPTDIASSLFDRLEQAWNQADGDAFGAAFTDDCDFVDIRGTHHQGASSVGHGHQAIFDSIYAGSVIRYRVSSARTIAPGCVLAAATATLDAPGGPTAGVNRSQVTAVATEQAGGWAIAAFHNTLVQSTQR